MNTMRTTSALVTACLLFLLMGVLWGCSDDDSITDPENTYVLRVSRIEGPAAISLGDTLWVTFAEIPLSDSCHYFHEIETLGASSELNIYRLWGKIEGASCAQEEIRINKTIAITNFDGIGTHYVFVQQPDDTTLSYSVLVETP